MVLTRRWNVYVHLMCALDDFGCGESATYLSGIAHVLAYNGSLVGYVWANQQKLGVSESR